MNRTIAAALTAVALFLVQPPGAALAGPIQDIYYDAALTGILKKADAALERGDHADALAILEPAADAGNADAMVGLAIMFGYGLGVEKNGLAAREALRAAAAQGHTLARALLEGIDEK